MPKIVKLAKRLEKEWEMMPNPFPKLEKHFSNLNQPPTPSHYLTSLIPLGKLRPPW
jgi:hypothetical protein